LDFETPANGAKSGLTSAPASNLPEKPKKPTLTMILASIDFETMEKMEKY
jgi:hypothetical protein